MNEMNQKNEASLKFALALERQLGESRVITDGELLASFAGDKSHCTPVVPQVAVRARGESDVVAVLAAAEKFGVPVVPRGAGTGKSGGAIPWRGGVVLDTTAMTDLLEVDKENLLAVVEPGMICGEFQKAVEKEGLFYPPDPNSLETCTLGGNVAHNAGGPRAFKYGVTRQYVMGTRAVLMGGQVVSPGKRTVKGVAGYDVTALLVGSEGTLGVFTRHTMKLIRKPPVIQTLLVVMRDEETAGRAVAAIVEKGLVPRVLEFMDGEVVAQLRKKGIAGVTGRSGALLLLEMDGDGDKVVEEQVLVLAELCEGLGATEVMLARHAQEREKLWAARRLMSDALAETAAHKVSEDIVVPRSKAPELLVRLKEMGARFGVRVAAYGHGGDGNYHVNVLWDDDDFAPEPLVTEVFKLTIGLGGTITGEHGVGIAKKPFLPMEQSVQLIELQRSIKRVFDPRGLLNPDKIF